MRSSKTPIKKVHTDSLYGSVLVAKMINGIMKSGKKSLAEKIVYQSIDKIAAQTGKNGLDYLSEAVENVKPTIEVRSRRVGGASYQVPTPIRPERRESLAIRWILNAARARSNSAFHTFSGKLTAEVMEAHENLGAAIKKKLDTQKMAEANKAFSHFRW